MKIKTTVLILMITMGSLSLFGQKKPACAGKSNGKICTTEQKQKSCGPNNTKIEEAAVVTELRNQFISLIQSIESDEIATSSWIGKNEDESLDLLQAGLGQIRQVAGLDLRAYDNSSKAKRILELTVDVEFVKNYLSSQSE